MNTNIKRRLTTSETPCSADLLVDAFEFFCSTYVIVCCSVFHTPGITLCFALQFVLGILLCRPIDFKTAAEYLIPWFCHDVLTVAGKITIPVLSTSPLVPVASTRLEAPS